MPKNRKTSLVLWFEEIGKNDVSLVGGKNASLGEMYCRLKDKGVVVPNGFTVSAHAYHCFIKESGLKKKIADSLKKIKTKEDLRALQTAGKRIRKFIATAAIPPDLEKEILRAYRKLSGERKAIDVAVRSSATAEDLPDASFAGQQETFLNVRGEKRLLFSVRKAFASLYTDRAISYRIDKGFSRSDIALSVGVQHMVRADLASSGVMFTLDTESGFDKVVIISAAYGLGENIVQGKVIPDQYTVFKPILSQNSSWPIIDKKLGSKRLQLVYSGAVSKATVNRRVSEKKRLSFVLKDREILTLARYGVVIERHYRRPMDIEWAKDGRDNKLYIVQARPETVHAGKVKRELVSYTLKKRGEIIVRGRSVGEKIAVGRARVIKDISGIHSFRASEILVTKMTDPDWEPIMKIASGIVTDSGGRTSHAAIVARELGIPAIVGTKNGSLLVRTGQTMTMSCAEGETGYLYKGELPFEVKTVKLHNIPKTKTKVMLILGEPDTAFSHSLLPVSGVGLARLEFIINNSVKIHPLALIHYGRLSNRQLKKRIAALTRGYQDKKEYFVDHLVWGIARLAAAFYPRDVIVRLSDFKSNEYANLIGGSIYEPQEENPMLGWRGASRFYHPKFAPAFKLECRALKRARERMGLSNIKVMVPFCRTLREARLVLDAMAVNGLRQGKNGLEVIMMMEIPSNVILARSFAKLFDGFSIGSNDLTQLTLGLDRDSADVASVGDERDKAVKMFMADAILKSREMGVPIGICGQAPSDFPEIARFLVEQSISSISVSPDRAIATLMNVARAESKRRQKKRK